MACHGCSQTGDCACAVIGDGGAVTVTGTGGALDPFVVTFDATDLLDGITTADPDLCVESWRTLARKSDGTVRLIPASGRCAVIV